MQRIPYNALPYCSLEIMVALAPLDDDQLAEYLDALELRVPDDTVWHELRAAARQHPRAPEWLTEGF